MQDLFVFEREGVDESGKVLGRFKPTGIRPRFADLLKARGVEFDGATFLDIDELSDRSKRGWDRRR
jgi:pilus assembly protein CpaF